MRIRYRYRGNEKIFDRLVESVVLGRPRDGVHVDIDLSPDLRVSRPHARISNVDGDYWIEDLGSTNGTEIEGRTIKGMGKVRFDPGQTICISETAIEVERITLTPNLNPSWTFEDGTLAGLPNTVEISESIRSTEPFFEPGQAIDPSRVQALALLHELPLRFSEEDNIDDLLQKMLDRLVEIAPSAGRGALLLNDPVTGELLLKAHAPIRQPSVNMALASRTMILRQGFIWRERLGPGRSQLVNQVSSGMYIPLIWKDRVLGAACVDNDDGGSLFSRDDLRLMLTAGHYISMAVVQNNLQNEIRRNSVLLGRLLTTFSPKVRETLLSQAAQGRLRPGGQKSELVLLEADIRGFTQLTSGMDSDDVMDLLNDYFSVLIDIIFKYDGTVDKINGDAIFAVFGSPEPDSLRHEKAVRAAFAMQAAVSEVSEKRKCRGQATCTIGIGVHCGEVLHGFIGSNDRMQLALIGDAANWTARYCAGAGGGEVLISSALHQHLWRHIDAELIKIETKHEGQLNAYRLKGPKTAP
jgi:adenylate cyclase